MAQWQRRVAELEENLAKAQKEVLKIQDTNSKLQRDLRENVAQKEDQVRLSLVLSLQMSSIVTMKMICSYLLCFLFSYIQGGKNSHVGKALC